MEGAAELEEGAEVAEGDPVAEAEAEGDAEAPDAEALELAPDEALAVGATVDGTGVVDGDA